jgi:hypothetical protein
MQVAAEAGINDPVGPFGNPDGSRADLDEVLDEFVDFQGNKAYGALATRASDAKVRVIVGKPGAGKTMYLRCLQDFQRHSGSVYATPSQQGIPSTDVIIRACQMFSSDVLSEKWLEIWHRAILRSLVTHLLTKPELRDHLEPAQEEELRTEYRGLIEPTIRSRTVYSELVQIISAAHTPKDLRDYLVDPRWNDLESLIGEILPQAPPIFFYLDAVDEEFDHAPMFWMQCHQGLFLQVMRLLRDQALGGRLHVVISIRDVVMSSILRSEHGPKYRDEPHIRLLVWDRSSLVYLLQNKLDRLPPQFFMRDPEEGRSLSSWLGVETIENDARGIEEQVGDYLLRHIRPIPRDLVSLGNALCEEILKQKNAGRTALPQADLRRVVSRVARTFGDSQLAQCANQVASDNMPPEAAKHGFAGLYTGTDGYNDDYTNGVGGRIRDLMRSLGVDRFDRSAMNVFEEMANEEWQRNVHLPSVLWQNGLLGFVDRYGTTTFYNLGDMDTFRIPDAATYVFHPCMIDSLGLKSVGQEPVRPF